MFKTCRVCNNDFPSSDDRTTCVRCEASEKIIGQISAFERWRGEVVQCISDLGVMDYSDADGIVMARESQLEGQHDAGITAEAAARQLLGWPAGDQQ